MASYRFLSEPWVERLDQLLAHQRFEGATEGWVIEVECTNRELPSDVAHLVFDEERLWARYGPAPGPDARVGLDRSVAEAMWDEQDPAFAAMVFQAGMVRASGHTPALEHLRSLLLAGTKQALVAAMAEVTERDAEAADRARRG